MSAASLSLWLDYVKNAEKAVADIREALHQSQLAAKQAEIALDRANIRIEETKLSLESAQQTLEECKRETVLNNYSDDIRKCGDDDHEDSLEEDAPLFLAAKISPSLIKNSDHPFKSKHSSSPQTSHRECPDCGSDCDSLCRFMVEFFSKHEYSVDINDWFEDNLPYMVPQKREHFRLQPGERWVFVSRSGRVLFRYPYTDIYRALDYVSTRKRWQLKIYKFRVDELQMMKHGVLRDSISYLHSDGEVNILYTDNAEECFAFYYNQ